jgi:hypothetical protein
MFENRLNVSSFGLVNKLSSTYREKMVSTWRRIVFLIEVMLNYIRPVSWRGTLELVLAEKKPMESIIIPLNRSIYIFVL